MAKGENALVAWLRERFAADARQVLVGIGDDMAVVRIDGTAVAITADMLLDGVHFEVGQHSYEQIGRKAMACSLSDCAAMACRPRAVTVSIALAETMSLADVQRLYEGMAEIADRYACAIVGGDTTSWSGRLAIDVAMLGEPMAVRGPVLRSTARPGDRLFVSGPLGGSLLGNHLSFEPRLALAEQLAGETGLHAMMDLSDGLSMDLHRMCEASGCDAELSAEELECAISDAARTVSRQDGISVIEHALNDGEDFELLIAGEAGLQALAISNSPNDMKSDRLEAGPTQDRGLVPRLLPVGRMVSRSKPGQTAVTLIGTNGQRRPVEPRGYEHFR